MTIDPKIQFWFGVLTSILLGVGNNAVHLPAGIPAGINTEIISWCSFLGWINTMILTAGAGFSSPKSGPLVPNGASIVKIIVLGLALSLLFPAAGFAADISTKTPSSVLTTGYPTKCGMYYGIGTGGNAGAVNGGVAGEQIVQGDLDALVGYTCPFAGNAFWFVEGQFGFANINGSQNGLSLSGPLVAIERAGVGSPIQQYLSGILPNLNFPAVPSTPSFNGATPAAPQSYLFAGLVEQDIGAQIGALSGHQWVVAPLIGAGLLTRYSNNMEVDTWAGWQMNSNSFCPGGGQSCGKLGNMARIGVSLKY